MDDLLEANREEIEHAIAEALREALPPLLARLRSLDDRFEALCRDVESRASQP